MNTLLFLQSYLDNCLFLHCTYLVSLICINTRAMSRVSATHDEEASARAAATEANTGAPTIFDKIISKEIPSTIIYEDEKVLAFRDINPQAPVHVLVIPKLRDGLTELGKAEPRHEDILGHLLHASKIVAEKEGIVDGFRVVINSGASACKLSIGLPSSFARSWWKTVEMATRLIDVTEFFGVVLFELLTGEKPTSLTRFDENRSSAIHHLTLAMKDGVMLSIIC
ncbi:hypothetical protein OSB04_027775 [Centaurea solstitialis]|uniref:HIT domain-containing protein n=1 Tax=Centaurea solstitialis TaxID=347529 RepID=A0AA38SFZ4_9ASTR|nr:hypothetical protein OSB04_027775 [Centaurea solstitialis]